MLTLWKSINDNALIIEWLVRIKNGIIMEIDKHNLIEEMLKDMGDRNNTIDLNAYGRGLIDMYDRVVKKCNNEQKKQEEENVLHIGNVNPLTAIRHGEYFTITPKLRYKKKEIDLDNGTYKTEYRLQQMWQGSEGTEEWQWIEYID